MRESISTVLRMWIRVLNTLDMQLYSTSPLLVVAAIYASLQEALEQPDVLPRAIQRLISPQSISIEPVTALAEQLSVFFSHSGYFAGLPAAATACAIFIVTIETEYGQALPISVINSLANFFGDKVAAGTVYTILERRKAMVIILNEYACLLPWISIPIGTLWNHQRTSAVLRALPDVLLFQRELEQLKRTECVEISSPLRLENVDSSQTVEADVLAGVPSTHAWTMIGNRKRPRGAQQAQRIISQMLDPTSSTLPLIDGTADAEAIQERLARIELQLLFGASEPLTRLQALSLQRGGEQNIDDDELFEPGELEGYQNSGETAHLLGDGHPEWNVAMKADSVNRGKRSKADTIPKDIRYSDDEEGGSVTDREYGNRDNGGHVDPEREAENYTLDRDAYLAFGILADYDGTDADTARYFGSNMEQF